MSAHPAAAENRVAVLVDCDNTKPEILEHALRVVAQFGRVVLRRGYGNHTTLADYVEARVIDGPNRSEQLQEIANIEHAMQQVEDSMEPGAPLTEHLLRGLHASVWWVNLGLGLAFIPLYLAAGQDARTNRFEVEAGLEKGGYR